jgi:DNA-binding transcriptional regulator/RsmH inhibitor MraZ
MTRKKTFGEFKMLRGWHELTTDGPRITLPYDFRSSIHALCAGQKAVLCLRAIENGAYEVTFHVSVTDDIEPSCVIRHMDNRGRIRLPKSLCNQLREEDSITVMLAGELDRFSIWIPSRLEESQRQFEEEFPVEGAEFVGLFPDMKKGAE